MERSYLLQEFAGFISRGFDSIVKDSETIEYTITKTRDNLDISLVYYLKLGYREKKENMRLNFNIDLIDIESMEDMGYLSVDFRIRHNLQDDDISSGHFLLEDYSKYLDFIHEDDIYMLKFEIPRIIEDDGFEEELEINQRFIFYQNCIDMYHKLD